METKSLLSEYADECDQKLWQTLQSHQLQCVFCSGCTKTLKGQSKNKIKCLFVCFKSWLFQVYYSITIELRKWFYVAVKLQTLCILKTADGIALMEQYSTNNLLFPLLSHGDESSFSVWKVGHCCQSFFRFFPGFQGICYSLKLRTGSRAVRHRL